MNISSNSILSKLLGTSLTLEDYIVCFIFLAIGLIIRRVVKTKDSISNDPYTPNKFNRKYWIRGNIRKINTIFTGIVMLYVILRFVDYLLDKTIKVELNANFSYFLSVCAGIGYDYLDDIFTKLERFNILSKFKKDA